MGGRAGAAAGVGDRVLSETAESACAILSPRRGDDIIEPGNSASASGVEGCSQGHLRAVRWLLERRHPTNSHSGIINYSCMCPQNAIAVDKVKGIAELCIAE